MRLPRICCGLDQSWAEMQGMPKPKIYKNFAVVPRIRRVARLRSPLPFKRSPSPSACCTEVYRTSQFTLYAQRVSLGIRPSYRRNLRGNFHASGVALWATLWGSTASRCNVRLESTNATRPLRLPIHEKHDGRNSALRRSNSTTLGRSVTETSV